MNHVVRHALLTTTLVTLIACEAPADIENPKSFTNEATSFSYPGNWRVTDQSHEDIDGIVVRTATIETPGDAIMVITMVDPADSMTLTAFAETTDEMRAAEMKNIVGKAESVMKLSKTRVQALEAAKNALPGSIRHDFAIQVLGENVPHWGDFHIFRGATNDVITYAQAAHEDWPKVRPGFDLVYGSMAPR